VGLREAHSYVCTRGENKSCKWWYYQLREKTRKKNFNANSSSKTQGKATMHHQPQQKKFVVEKDQCLYYKKTGHYKKDYPNFLKMIMAKKGENIITFINESLYVRYSKSTWWINLGATVHVANSLQGLCLMGTT
jgi:hypothetical protein